MAVDSQQLGHVPAGLMRWRCALRGHEGTQQLAVAVIGEGRADVLTRVAMGAGWWASLLP